MMPPNEARHIPKALVKRYEDSSCCRFLAHLAWAAFFAMADLSSGVSFSARAFPPHPFTGRGPLTTMSPARVFAGK
jgi:hypothetical protein